MNHLSGVKGKLSPLHHSLLLVNSLFVIYFCFSVFTLLPRVCAFLLFSLCFFGGAEANTTVFLYINSCTLNTIQLLTKLSLWACLLFPSRLLVPACLSFDNFRFAPCFLPFFCLCVLLFHISSFADTLTGTTHFILFILVLMIPSLCMSPALSVFLSCFTPAQ